MRFVDPNRRVVTGLTCIELELDISLGFSLNLHLPAYFMNAREGSGDCADDHSSECLLVAFEDKYLHLMSWLYYSCGKSKY